MDPGYKARDDHLGVLQRGEAAALSPLSRLGLTLTVKPEQGSARLALPPRLRHTVARPNE
jgi:hypothetical protein